MWNQHRASLACLKTKCNKCLFSHLFSATIILQDGIIKVQLGANDAHQKSCGIPPQTANTMANIHATNGLKYKKYMIQGGKTLFPYTTLFRSGAADDLGMKYYGLQECPKLPHQSNHPWNAPPKNSSSPNGSSTMNTRYVVWQSWFAHFFS